MAYHKYNVYVWDGAVGDDDARRVLGATLSAGLVVVAANNEEQAWELLKAYDPVTWWNLQGRPTTPISKHLPHDGNLVRWILNDIAPYVRGFTARAVRPRVLTEPEVLYRRPVY